MSTQKPDFFALMNKMINLLSTPEYDDNYWDVLQFLYATEVQSSIRLYRMNPDSKNAITELVAMKVEAEKLLEKIAALKASPLLTLTNDRMECLDGLVVQMEKITNEPLVTR
ncbi:hypothetical protein ABIE26_000218 [Pedobacter africanus]|uniref:Uncharacterized protein n=1 Tax=Pedobacter africanus TaxID=151894 RepID=A0ACC6KVC6_9SPHI|nr:hypothetical protein [Pedobacter africanus]MDR6783294.1 hypothetical protein [Pedobacter africanus]